MKKAIFTLLTFIVIAIAGPAAAASGLSVTAGYEYLRPNKGQADPLRYQQTGTVGVGMKTTLGVIDAKLIGVQTVTGVKDNGLGYEIGYTNGVKTFTGGLLKGRLGYGKINQVDLKTGVIQGNQRWYTLGGELSAPVSHRAGAYVAYEHRQGMTTGTPIQNKWSGGVDLNLVKNVDLRVGYTYAINGGLKENGLAMAATYEF